MNSIKKRKKIITEDEYEQSSISSFVSENISSAGSSVLGRYKQERE
jgi:hypothetical protein